jgi:ankyrin repeat protein
VKRAHAPRVFRAQEWDENHGRQAERAEEYAADNPDAPRGGPEKVMAHKVEHILPVVAAQLATIMFPASNLPTSRMLTREFFERLSREGFDILRQLGITHKCHSGVEAEIRELLEPRHLAPFIVGDADEGGAAEIKPPSADEILDKLAHLEAALQRAGAEGNSEEAEAALAHFSVFAKETRAAAHGLPAEARTHVALIIDNIDIKQFMSVMRSSGSFDAWVEVCGRVYDGTPAPLPAPGCLPALPTGERREAAAARADERARVTRFFASVREALVSNDFLKLKPALECLTLKPALGDVCGADGDTAVGQAARAGGVGVVRALLAAGARRAAPGPNGWTGLHSACVAMDADMLRALLADGGDPNVCDKDERTPMNALLHKALEGDPQWASDLAVAPPDPLMACVHVLVDNGADCTRPDCGGTSPMGLLLERCARRHDLVGLLCSAGHLNILSFNQAGETLLHILARRAAALQAAEPALLAPGGAVVRTLEHIMPPFTNGFAHQVDRKGDIAYDFCPECDAMRTAQPAPFEAGGFWGILRGAFNIADVCHCKGACCACGCTRNLLCCRHPPALPFGPAPAPPGAAPPGGQAGGSSSAARRGAPKPPKAKGCSCGDNCKNPLMAALQWALKMRAAGLDATFARIGRGLSTYQGGHFCVAGIVLLRAKNIPPEVLRRLLCAPLHTIDTVTLDMVLRMAAADKLALADLHRRQLGCFLLPLLVHTLTEEKERVEGCVQFGYYDPFGTLREQLHRPEVVSLFRALSVQEEAPNCYEHIVTIIKRIMALTHRKGPDAAAQRAATVRVPPPTEEERDAAYTAAAAGVNAAAGSEMEEEEAEEDEGDEGDGAAPMEAAPAAAPRPKPAVLKRRREADMAAPTAEGAHRTPQGAEEEATLKQLADALLLRVGLTRAQLHAEAERLRSSAADGGAHLKSGDHVFNSFIDSLVELCVHADAGASAGGGDAGGASAGGASAGGASAGGVRDGDDTGGDEAGGPAGGDAGAAAAPPQKFYTQVVADAGIAVQAMPAYRNGHIGAGASQASMHTGAHVAVAGIMSVAQVSGFETVLSKATTYALGSLKMIKQSPSKIGEVHAVTEHTYVGLATAAMGVCLAGVKPELKQRLAALAKRLASLPAEKVVKAGMFDPAPGAAAADGLTCEDVDTVWAFVDEYVGTWLPAQCAIGANGERANASGLSNNAYLLTRGMSWMWVSLMMWDSTHNGHGALELALRKESIPIFAATVSADASAKGAAAADADADAEMGEADAVTRSTNYVLTTTLDVVRTLTSDAYLRALLLTNVTVWRTLSALLRKSGGGVPMDEHTESYLVRAIKQFFAAQLHGTVSLSTLQLGAAFGAHTTHTVGGFGCERCCSVVALLYLTPPRCCLTRCFRAMPRHAGAQPTAATSCTRRWWRWAGATSTRAKPSSSCATRRWRRSWWSTRRAARGRRTAPRRPRTSRTTACGACCPRATCCTARQRLCWRRCAMRLQPQSTLRLRTAPPPSRRTLARTPTAATCPSSSWSGSWRAPRSTTSAALRRRMRTMRRGCCASSARRRAAPRARRRWRTCGRTTSPPSRASTWARWPRGRS